VGCKTVQINANKARYKVDEIGFCYSCILYTSTIVPDYSKNKSIRRGQREYLFRDN
jgi:hypothetical protein